MEVVRWNGMFPTITYGCWGNRKRRISARTTVTFEEVR
jgi:hypothetical protein